MYAYRRLQRLWTCRKASSSGQCRRTCSRPPGAIETFSWFCRLIYKYPDLTYLLTLPDVPWRLWRVALFITNKDTNCRNAISPDKRILMKETRDKPSTLQKNVAVSFDMSKENEYVQFLSTHRATCRRNTRGRVDAWTQTVWTRFKRSTS